MWVVKSIFALLVVGTIGNCVPTDPIDLPQAVSDFALDLYEQVAKSKPGNVIISPLSVATALALLSQAANGRTYTELQHGLHLDGIDKITVATQYHRFTEQLQRHIGSAEFILANQIYVQQGHTLNNVFQKVATTKFRSGVQTVNFKDAVKSAEIINNFVTEKTHGKIPKLVDSNSLSADTDVMLVNAIYFKGKWEHPFDKKLTHKGPFYTSNKQTIWTEFMQLEHNFNIIHSDELQASLIELKYADSKLSFVIAVPHRSSNLDQLTKRIKQTKLDDIVRQMRPQHMTLSVPKFKVQFEIELEDVLKQLHMGTMFTANANLNGLLGENDIENLVISKVIHKAVIEIDESGSEASGSTGTETSTSALTKFTIDSPFLYFIRDTDTNTIIFNGRIETVARKLTM